MTTGMLTEEKRTMSTKRELLPSERLHQLAGALHAELPQTAEIIVDIAFDVADLEKEQN